MMNGLQRRDNWMDNMFNWFDRGFEPETMLSGASMRTDIAEDDHAYQVKIDMPGFAKDDVHLSYDQDVLTVTGHRDAQSEAKDNAGNLLHTERRYGQFSRQYRLPEVDRHQISAKYENGVLTVTLPKLAASDKADTTITID